jgi:isopenicillin N synthase-like dioxygenase
MMARWTDDRWVATLHRVAMPPPSTQGRAGGRLGPPRRPSVRRQTLVFFHDPRADAVIEAIGGSGRYKPVTAGEYVLAKAAKALERSATSRV